MLNLIRRFAQWPLPRPNNKRVATWSQFRFENDSVYDEVTDSEMTLFGAAAVSDGMLRVSAASTSNYAEFNHVTFDANEDFYIRATFSSNTPSGSWINQAILGQWSVNAGISSWLITHVGPAHPTVANRNKIGFIYKDSNSVVHVLPSAQVVGYGELHTVEVVRKAGTITVYVDGVAGESVYAPLGNPIYNYPKNRVFRFASTNTYEQGGGRRDDIQIIKGASNFTPGIKPALPKYVRPEYSVNDADAMILQLGFRRGSKLCEINDTPVTLNGTANITKDARLNVTATAASYAQVSIPYFGAGDFTIEFCIKATAISSYGWGIGHFYASNSASEDNRWLVYRNSAGQIGFAMARSANVNDSFFLGVSNHSYKENQDNHFVIERQNGTIRIVVNGALVGEGYYNGAMRAGAGVFRTNHFNNATFFAGSIWNIRIADKALYSIEGEQDGFYGEVAAADFITGDELSNLTSYTQGVSQNSDTAWLKFKRNGKTLYVPKKQIRHSVDWNALRTANLVYGDRQVTIRGKTYKVRLLKSMAGDTLNAPAYTGTWYYSHPVCFDSEFNHLFYPITFNSRCPVGSTSADGIVFGSKAQYTEDELGFSQNNTLYTQCQESYNNIPLERGLFGVDSHYVHNFTYVGPSRQWRPVLELVE